MLLYIIVLSPWFILLQAKQLPMSVILAVVLSSSSPWSIAG